MVFKKIKYFLLGLWLVLFAIFLIMPKNYHKTYNVDGYTILESYDKSNNNYYFKISDDTYTYDLNINNKYLNKKKLIKSISTYQVDNEVCIVPEITKLRSIPLCKVDGSAIGYHLVNSAMQENFLEFIQTSNNDNTSYNNINIYNLINKKYLIWNYNDLKLVNSDGNSSVNLFNNDYYNIDLGVSINNYFVIPNYDQGYTFNELIIYNLKNNKKSTWEINYNISLNSYIVGVYNKSIYLVDMDNKIEYEIVPHVKKIRIVGTENHDGVIYDEGLKKIDFNLLLQSKLSFNYGYLTNFKLDNGKLLYVSQNYPMVASNYKVKNIVYSDNNEVFYLVNDSLYHFDIFNGEQKVMQNFEWNFNYNNVIFPY